MRPHLAAVFALGLLISGCAEKPPEAPKPPDALVAKVTADLNRMLLERGAYEPGDGTPAGAGGVVASAPLAMFSAIDVNNDGIVDWRVDLGKAPNPSFFCGSGGCANQVYVSKPGGELELTWQATIGPDMPISVVNGERVMDVNFHGTVCDLAGADACPRRYAWVEAERRWQERPNVRGQTVLRGPLIQVKPLNWTDLPRQVQAEARTIEGACKAAGGKLYDGPISVVESIPDVSGDGVRDWVVGGHATCEELPAGALAPLLTMGVWATAPEETGGARPLYATLNANYAIDVVAKPAIFVLARTGTECGESGICPDSRLTYDASIRSLSDPMPALPDVGAAPPSLEDQMAQQAGN